jgi:hypothetical protein
LSNNWKEQKTEDPICWYNKKEKFRLGETIKKNIFLFPQFLTNLFINYSITSYCLSNFYRYEKVFIFYFNDLRVCCLFTNCPKHTS